MTQPQDPVSKQNSGRHFSYSSIGSFFASLKLAIVLILVLVGLSLIGAFVIQVPAEYAASPQGYAWWLENIAQTQTGAWYPLFKLLGFFNLFHSIWFITTGLLLVINIIVCSLTRLKGVIARLRLKPPVPSLESFQGDKNSQIISGIQSMDTLVSFLNNRGYQTVLSRQAGETYMAAIKNRFSPLGTYLVHFSLILFILGFVLGHYWGFENSSFTVAEGQTESVGQNTGLALKLDSFKVEYYPDGSPQDYRSQVTLLKNQNQVMQKEIRVNHPLNYQGIRFYQSYFGLAEMIKIERNGTILYNGQLTLDNTMDNHPYIRPSGRLILPDQKYTIYLVAPATNISDPALQKDQLAIELYQDNNPKALAAGVLNLNSPLTAGDLEITFTGSGHFSGFLVNSDPGIGLVWTAAIFLLLGLVSVFYFPRRQLRAALIQNPEKGRDLYLKWENSGENSGEARKLVELLNSSNYKEQSGSTGKEGH